MPKEIDVIIEEKERMGSDQLTQEIKGKDSIS